MANQFMPEKEVLKLKQEFPPGTRILLNQMNDTYMDGKFAVQSGIRGTVDHIDDGGALHMRWDNGRSLPLMPEADDFRKLTEHELLEEQQLTHQNQGEQQWQTM